jgi:L-alanine-DL-glutamate epimerase-like enolase superfamily enzyme
MDRVSIGSVKAWAFTVPTDEPESDGTLQWDSTTAVVVEVSAGNSTGLGYSYTDASARALVEKSLAGAIAGRDAMDVPAAWEAMVEVVRNLGRPGIASSAIAAVDVALWDLKAKLLGVALVDLLGAARPAVPVYGSGGFTSYEDARLEEQLGAWVDDGFTMVKMKVGRDPHRDPKRVALARRTIGDATLMVDANGAYGLREAVRMAHEFGDLDVTWFEEPVSSDDLAGLREIRTLVPPGMEVAAGEYGYDVAYFARMLDRRAVDVLQADATRCGGITGFMMAADLCRAAEVPLSAHTAPSLHLHPCCAAPELRHVEYFHDHVRLEPMLFDGVIAPRRGVLEPDRARPGIGLDLKRADARGYLVGGDL